jgi:hypothetical protein
MWFRLKLWAALLFAIITAAWIGGRNSTRKTELKNYAKTRERMDEVSGGDDPAVLREWLRERGKQ